jgi:(S)-mandelate dehydrogenase
VNIADLRRIAQRRLPRAIFDFFDGGAEDETTLRDNCAAFQRVRCCPKCSSTSRRSITQASVFRARSRAPTCRSRPTGGISAGRYGAELILARGGKGLGRALYHGHSVGFLDRASAEEVGGRCGSSSIA